MFNKKEPVLTPELTRKVIGLIENGKTKEIDRRGSGSETISGEFKTEKEVISYDIYISPSVFQIIIYGADGRFKYINCNDEDKKNIIDVWNKKIKSDEDRVIKEEIMKEEKEYNDAIGMLNSFEG